VTARVVTESESTTFALWREVNRIASSTEDRDVIRQLLGEARIDPGTHVGVEPDDFTPVMVAEWVLGQWAEMIDAGSPFLNSARNISLSQWKRVAEPLGYGPNPEWDAAGEMFCAEVNALAGHLGDGSYSQLDANGDPS
jgi:hypothetical protein